MAITLNNPTKRPSMDKANTRNVCNALDAWVFWTYYHSHSTLWRELVSSLSRTSVTNLENAKVFNMKNNNTLKDWQRFDRWYYDGCQRGFISWGLGLNPGTHSLPPSLESFGWWVVSVLCGSLFHVNFLILCQKFLNKNNTLNQSIFGYHPNSFSRR